MGAFYSEMVSKQSSKFERVKKLKYKKIMKDKSKWTCGKGKGMKKTLKIADKSSQGIFIA